LIFDSNSSTLLRSSLFDSISRATIFSYFTALYPLSLVSTISGKTFSTSCAITPISFLPLNTSCLSFHTNVLPLSNLIFSFGFSIGVIKSLYLSSEEAYATTSSPTLSVFAIPTPPSTRSAPVVLHFD
jgi:hypothetical protein